MGIFQTIVNKYKDANQKSLNKKETHSVGDTFNEQGYELHITGIERKESYRDDFVSEDIKSKNGEFILIKIFGQNKNDKPTALFEDGFQLKTNGKTYNIDHTYQSNGCLLCESNPDSIQEETFNWDVPKGLTGIELLTPSNEINLGQ